MPRYQSPVFIISIGNIITGGSGKTPFTIYLADYLKHKGFKVAVSHRGYKGELENATCLISDREGLLPVSDKSGDEGWLLARRLSGIPVTAGRDRKKAIRLLYETFPDLDCIILDDSFQHLSVKHDLDIIIVNDMLRFGNGFVLPAGYLREPLSALSDADLLILNQINRKIVHDEKFSKQLHTIGKPIVKGFYALDKIYSFYGEEVPIDKVTSEKVYIITGIGNPSGFESLLKTGGFSVIGSSFFPDHYSFQDKLCRDRMVSDFRRSGAKWMAVTEKDYAKLRFYPEFTEFTLVIGISFLPVREDANQLHSIIVKYINNKALAG